MVKLGEKGLDLTQAASERTSKEVYNNILFHQVPLGSKSSASALPACRVKEALTKGERRPFWNHSEVLRVLQQPSSSSGGRGVFESGIW